MIAVGIFAKPPYPGLVKTRLIPDIGAVKAARVYRYCLEYTLELVRQSGLDYSFFSAKSATMHSSSRKIAACKKAMTLANACITPSRNCSAEHPMGY